MPFVRERYPADWPEISRRIRFERAGGRCEWCGVAHKERGARDRYGVWHNEDDIESMNSSDGAELFGAFPRIIRIILTVAHIDHDTRNNTEDNLAALCQRCHLKHDAAHHARNAAATRDSKRGQLRLTGDNQ